MSASIFPNLFIIGAMKAGTSSLHEYLHQHPQIFMSRMKEPQYFAPHVTRQGLKWGQGNPCPEPGVDWYLRLFDEAGDVRYAGESSVSYTARPWVEGSEQRIYDFNPNARLIYLLRDPIERTISHYWHFVADGREDRDMLTAIRRKDEYIARSNYAMQLRPYLELFGREQIFVLTLEEMNANPTATFCKLFAWLGVDTKVHIDIGQRHNVGSPSLRQTRRGMVWLDTFLKGWRWNAWKERASGTINHTLRRLAYKNVLKASVDEGPAVSYVRPILERHTESLREMLGREFSEWTTLYAESSAMVGQDELQGLLK